MTAVAPKELERPDEQQFWEQVPCRLAEDVQKCLITMCQKSTEAEICGFITSDGAILPVPNVDENPGKGFTMDKQRMVEIITAHNNIVGTYHSHLSGRPWPSSCDTNNIGFLYAQGCPWDYHIVTDAGVFQYEHRDRRRWS